MVRACAPSVLSSCSSRSPRRRRGHPGEIRSTLTYTAAPGCAARVTFTRAPTHGDPRHRARRARRRRRPDPGHRLRTGRPGLHVHGYRARSCADLGDGNDLADASHVRRPGRVRRRARPPTSCTAGAAPTRSTAATATTCSTAAPATTRSTRARATTRSTASTGARRAQRRRRARRRHARDARRAAPAARSRSTTSANDGLPGEGDNYASDIEDVSILGQVASWCRGVDADRQRRAPNELTTGRRQRQLITARRRHRPPRGRRGRRHDRRPRRLQRPRPLRRRHRRGHGRHARPDRRATARRSTWPTSATRLDDQPPTIAWATPRARGCGDPANPLHGTAADDRGVALVRFLDDDRVRRARSPRRPTRAPTGPRGDDVGRNTLSRSRRHRRPDDHVQRAVTVDRFQAAGQLDGPARFTVTGRLEHRRRGLPRAHGDRTRCASAGGTLATRTAKLTRRCSYSVTLRVSAASSSSPLRRHPFGGSALVTPTELCSSSASASAIPRDLAEVDRLVGGVDLRRGRSPARPRARTPRPGRRRAAWRRAGPSRRCPSARRACRTPARARARRRAAPGSAIGVDAGSTSISSCAPHGVCARRWRSTAAIERTGSAPGGTRTAILARACGITMLPAPSTGGRVEAEDGDRVARPQAVGDVAGADQPHAVEHAGLAAEVGLGPAPRRPSRRPRALPRRRCRRRRAGSRSGGSARAARPARRRRSGRCAARSLSVRSVTVSLPWPRSVCDSVGSPTFQLPLSAITITSARIRSGSLVDDLEQRLAPVLLRALDRAPSRGPAACPRARAARRGGRRCRTCRRRRRGRRRGRPRRVGANGSVSQPSGGAGWTS